MSAQRIVIIGAGMGGLTAGLELAHQGLEVHIVDKAGAPGGKLREVAVGDAKIDAGPTVFTMRWIFEALFSAVGERLEDHLSLAPMQILARHAWDAEQRLDLYADMQRSHEAIAAFAGGAEADRYVAFCRQAQKTYQALDTSFMRDSRPSLTQLISRVTREDPRGLMHITPFASLWRALGKYFKDPRLQQLFGRYATYCGSSPFLAPATLMLIAHVEQEGVWMVDGGMARIPEALAKLAQARGARLHSGVAVQEILVKGGRACGVLLDNGERLEADAVISNTDYAALAAGHYGASLRTSVPQPQPDQRSLSAITWTLNTRTQGFPLLRHNVFFNGDYAAEFEAIFARGALPAEPTIYICAQDRADIDSDPPDGSERLLCLVNAPARGDQRAFDESEVSQCRSSAQKLLARCGLQLNLDTEAGVMTTPAHFEHLFPASGGGLYGQATHGWQASFRRPGARSQMPGLYLAGGSVHPGAGVPMASLSGRLAAAAVLQDLTSARR
ncbi:1-hydroxycarotenoid 3,4-desaturase [Ectothiorhodosinus mongolicus]|uniref:1-hydroxycarotenoid 3,4-desaturase n=1 Tax=Ectothiorhodosinus mongolicus TaxID=233100 RepID=A0A1R3W686_9GAMM|nr:1-hydroxycarotenoid 3,4-desaturase CrtD [Ectothiorhodosinus mongolicus]ULX57629.1 phytoene desaturase [Ectothiorhodosinus mongolicus]SIT73190.1 1-hydroxycarotenoid 3,4-desaturase [Ectothiorhodosinus mongolicus]